MQRLRGNSINEEKLNGYTIKLTEVDDSKVKPVYEEGCPIFDFESGTLTNWTMKGKAFQHQPKYSDTRSFREGSEKPTGISGNWWISGLHNGVEGHSGELISPIFTITTPQISFLIGGGSSDQYPVGIELIVQRKVIHKIYLKNQHWKTLQRHEFDVSQHYRKTACIRLFDGTFRGYLMFDDLRTVENCKDGESFFQ